MKMQHRVWYMVTGGILALGLAFGAYATFAQTDDSAGTAQPEITTPDADSDSGSALDALPFFGGKGRGGHDFDSAPRIGDNENSLLADALGITTDELQAAKETAAAAAIEQAVADGVLTQEQADELLARGAGRFGRDFHGIGGEQQTFLADALGITTDELTAAVEQVQAARLAQMVTDGVITQEQADMMQAYQDVRSYVDTDALSESIQAIHTAAIEQALADGVITQAQADQMLSAVPNMGMRGFGGPGFGMGGRGGRGHHGHGGGFGTFQSAPAGTTTDASNA